MAVGELRLHPSNRPIILNNDSCVYCGRDLTPETKTKEHVIGRRFVPRGTFDKQWSLIVNACAQCNNFKGKLEDEVSAITMQPDAHGRFPNSDCRLIEESNRKGSGSFSSRTGDRVSNSQEKITIKSELASGVSFEIGLDAPPQLDREKAFLLARLHNMGFFYLITYDKKKGKGRFWPGDYFPLEIVPRSDWGNPRVLHVVDLVRDWKFRVIGDAADGFFRIVIKRHPDADCWYWAQEWNKNYRLVGLFGCQAAISEFKGQLPILKHSKVPLREGGTFLVASETALEAAEDQMFECSQEIRPEGG